MRRTESGSDRLNTAGGGDLAGPRYERELARRADECRRSGGVFYTPADVADFIVEQTLRPLVAEMPANGVRSLRVLDPACGCGAFLLAAYRWLCDWRETSAGHRLRPTQRRAIARRLAGIDIDPVAVKLARESLGKAAGLPAAELADNIRVGDALLAHDDWFCGRFDAVVTNPPYVNIRRLAKSREGALADAYRRRYRCAAGAFDLYTLFVERSVAALAAGGRIGAIVPNKLATLDYARPCRELLLSEGTLDAVVDVSGLGIFADADVYPYIVVWTKRPPTAEHAIRVVRPVSLAAVGRPFRAVQSVDGPEGPSHGWSCVLQSRQRADRGLTLGGELDVESRAATVPLGELCTIHSGATGFQAAELAARLIERNECGLEHAPNECSTFEFIVSGNIDPYAIELGNVRFMGRQLKRPILPADDPILSTRKQQLYAAPKIVLAGMCRHLEAAFDSRGLALGVQVYALTDWQVDPHYLLGVLNSSVLTQLFRLRFAAKRLAGGYFSLSKKQLAQLPIRMFDRSDRMERRLHDRLVDLVRRRLKSADPLGAATLNLDAQIDDLVSRLYHVAPGELAHLPAAA
jgi:adenine-specific DNA-methyltransferase